ncbi:N-acetylglutamate synthase /glutamate N-acetyltransferase [Alkalispirochaeta americana]|uniref:Arginine biosynthesis bifunctional protein ArgJ n=1 Tax=Alkalispirochaeta americana TaxID=159291 RepID=A0A1N6UEJ6_9SPIO|nr:bifunctional ornithine acetyltransferase/N-acetylglutamate synthase [Alkalispirochaeta americana]SIQ64020.1 N-acetylglutamate synthase /glutamate N-acetyltransferase [Alkalispirochaeta americana]
MPWMNLRRASSAMVDLPVARAGESWRETLDRTALVPRGFGFFRRRLSFVPVERPASQPCEMNLAWLHNQGPEYSAAAVTTSNRFPGAPVVLTRERLARGVVRAILVNTKVANVAAPGGLETARRVAAAAAEAFSLPREEVLSVSTGVIGWGLPLEEMLREIPSLSQGACGAGGFAEAIMTTDRYPKAAWTSLDPDGPDPDGPDRDGTDRDGTDRDGTDACGGPVILGVAKGAGMIEPHLATMLAFFVTDAAVPPDMLDRVLRRVTEKSFNRLSVDSDQSTSDMVVALANGASGCSVGEAELEAAWQPLADRLALEIVRNGEGTSHVIEVVLKGFPSSSLAGNVGRHVVNSPLVKTAIFGNDPNVGRILMALGDGLSRYDREGIMDTSRLVMTIAGREVYRQGAFLLDQETEELLCASLRATAMDPVLAGVPQDRGTVRIVLDFPGDDREDVRVIGSDLSDEYLRVNADYRT